jgi:hypothetical protein
VSVRVALCVLCLDDLRGDPDEPAPLRTLEVNTFGVRQAFPVHRACKRRETASRHAQRKVKP